MNISINFNRRNSHLVGPQGIDSLAQRQGGVCASRCMWLSRRSRCAAVSSRRITWCPRPLADERLGLSAWFASHCTFGMRAVEGFACLVGSCVPTRVFLDSAVLAWLTHLQHRSRAQVPRYVRHKILNILHIVGPCVYRIVPSWVSVLLGGFVITHLSFTSVGLLKCRE